MRFASAVVRSVRQKLNPNINWINLNEDAVYKHKNEWMSEWVSERMNEWMNEWKKEWINESMMESTVKHSTVLPLLLYRYNNYNTLLCQLSAE